MKNKIKKILFTVSLTILFALPTILSACTNVTSSYNPGDDIYEQFIIVDSIYDFNFGYLYTVYDKDTKVMYYISSGSHKSGISPIYNTDGTVKIYQE